MGSRTFNSGCTAACSTDSEKQCCKNIRWSVEMQEKKLDLSDGIRELIADLEDLQSLIAYAAQKVQLDRR